MKFYEITNEDHIGVQFAGLKIERVGLIKHFWKDKYIGLELDGNENDCWHRNSKLEYIKEVFNMDKENKVKWFKTEELLIEWLKEKL